MLFKNLIVYRLPENWSWEAGELETRLGAHALKACGPFEMSCRGW
jgi:DNA recombination-dependent growth factor C